VRHIPQFPDSRAVELGDKPFLDELFAAMRPEISAYTFTNLFSWREPHAVGLSRVGERLIAHYNDGPKRVCLQPLGAGPAKPTIEEAIRVSGTEVEFAYLHSDAASEFDGDPAFATGPDRDNSDYLYLASDLIELAGRKFDAKRNFISRFKSQWQYEYVRITPNTAQECHEFAQQWCVERRCDTVEGLKREKCAVYQMLANFEALGLVGGAIKVDGAVVAFSIGEALNPETMVVHVEKADARFDGIYQVISNEFSIHEAAGFTYINREQDLGVPGLRKAKESYHPVRLVETWRVAANSQS